MHNRKNMEFFSRIVREVLLFISFSYTLQQNELRIKTGYVSVNFSLSSKRLSQFSGCTKSWRVLGLRTFFGVQLFFDTVLVRKPSVSHLEKTGLRTLLFFGFRLTAIYVCVFDDMRDTETIASNCDVATLTYKTQKQEKFCWGPNVENFNIYDTKILLTIYFCSSWMWSIIVENRKLNWFREVFFLF